MDEKKKKLAKVIPLYPQYNVVLDGHIHVDGGVWDVFITVDGEPMVIQNVCLYDVDGLSLEFSSDYIHHDLERKDEGDSCPFCQAPAKGDPCKVLNLHLQDILKKTLQRDFTLQLLAERYTYEDEAEIAEQAEEIKPHLYIRAAAEDEVTLACVFGYLGESYLYTERGDGEEVSFLVKKPSEDGLSLIYALEMMNPPMLEALHFCMDGVSLERRQKLDPEAFFHIHK